MFLLRRFRSDARKAGIADESLREAVRLFEGGLGDRLKGNLFKIRVARRGAGKSSGFRVLLACRRPNGHLFFLDLFAKNDKENLHPLEENFFVTLAETVVNYSDSDIAELVAANALVELDASS